MSKEQIEELRKDLIEIFDEEYEKRRIITADFTAIKTAAKGYRKQGEPISCGHEKGGGWISVDERLPEENGRCLVCVAIRHLVFEDLTMVVIMGYNKINGFDVVSGEETVTHWMPLPEAPKMKGGAE